MDFKQQLIKKLKKYPDLYNEIRAEVVVSRFEGERKDEELVYKDPTCDNLLNKVEDEELINSIIDNLKYYIEYERELGESDI